MSDNIEKSKSKYDYIEEILYFIVFIGLVMVLIWGISIYLK